MVLENLKSKILKEVTHITLVHSGERPFSSDVILWLVQEKWRIVEFRSMIGSETEVLVAFIEDKYANMEVFSRARKQLIIVTK